MMNSPDECSQDRLWIHNNQDKAVPEDEWIKEIKIKEQNFSFFQLEAVIFVNQYIWFAKDDDNDDETVCKALNLQ